VTTGAARLPSVTAMIRRGGRPPESAILQRDADALLPLGAPGVLVGVTAPTTDPTTDLVEHALCGTA
jgi:hypothetical protein